MTTPLPEILGAAPRGTTNILRARSLSSGTEKHSGASCTGSLCRGRQTLCGSELQPAPGEVSVAAGLHVGASTPRDGGRSPLRMAANSGRLTGTSLPARAADAEASAPCCRDLLPALGWREDSALPKGQELSAVRSASAVLQRPRAQVEEPLNARASLDLFRTSEWAYFHGPLPPPK
eukprot:5594134-Prymnesium_polylepis.1